MLLSINQSYPRDNDISRNGPPVRLSPSDEGRETAGANVGVPVSAPVAPSITPSAITEIALIMPGKEFSSRFYSRTHALMETGHYTEAKELCDLMENMCLKNIDSGNYDKEDFLALGHIAELRGNAGIAVRYYEAAVKTDPSGGKARVFLAATLKNNGYLVRAKEILEEDGAWERCKESGWGEKYWQCYAETLYGLGGNKNFEKALLIFEELAERARGGSKAAAGDETVNLYSVAFYLEKMGKKTEARSLLEKACILDPKDTEVLETLAGIYLDTNEYSKALDTAKKILEVLPGNTGVLTKAALAGGLLYVQTGRREHLEETKMYLSLLESALSRLASVFPDNAGLFVYQKYLHNTRAEYKTENDLIERHLQRSIQVETRERVKNSPSTMPDADSPYGFDPFSMELTSKGPLNSADKEKLKSYFTGKGDKEAVDRLYDRSQSVELDSLKKQYTNNTIYNSIVEGRDFGFDGKKVRCIRLPDLDPATGNEKFDPGDQLASFLKRTVGDSGYYNVAEQKALINTIREKAENLNIEDLNAGEAVMLAAKVTETILEPRYDTETADQKHIPVEEKIAAGKGVCRNYAAMFCAVFDAIKSVNSGMKNLYSCPIVSSNHVWNLVFEVRKDEIVMCQLDTTADDGMSSGFGKNLEAYDYGHYFPWSDMTPVEEMGRKIKAAGNQGWKGRALLEHASLLARDKKFRGAKKDMEEFGSLYPSASLTPEAHRTLAGIALSEKNTAEAEKQFLLCAEKSEGDEKAAVMINMAREYLDAAGKDGELVKKAEAIVTMFALTKDLATWAGGKEAFEGSEEEIFKLFALAAAKELERGDDSGARSMVIAMMRRKGVPEELKSSYLGLLGQVALGNDIYDNQVYFNMQERYSAKPQETLLWQAEQYINGKDPISAYGKLFSLLNNYPEDENTAKACGMLAEVSSGLMDKGNVEMAKKAAKLIASKNIPAEDRNRYLEMLSVKALFNYSILESSFFLFNTPRVACLENEKGGRSFKYHLIDAFGKAITPDRVYIRVSTDGSGMITLDQSEGLRNYIDLVHESGFCTATGFKAAA